MINSGYLLDCDWFFLVAMWHTPPSDGNWNFSIVKRVEGLCYHFGKIIFFKALLGDWKILVAFNGVGVSDHNKK